IESAIFLPNLAFLDLAVLDHMLQQVQGLLLVHMGIRFDFGHCRARTSEMRQRSVQPFLHLASLLRGLLALEPHLPRYDLALQHHRHVPLAAFKVGVSDTFIDIDTVAAVEACAGADIHPEHMDAASRYERLPAPD